MTTYTMTMSKGWAMYSESGHHLGDLANRVERLARQHGLAKARLEFADGAVFEIEPDAPEPATFTGISG
jgi:hypothetical protein